MYPYRGGNSIYTSIASNHHMALITLCHFDPALAGAASPPRTSPLAELTGGKPLAEGEKSRTMRRQRGEISRGVYPAQDAGLEMTSQPMDY
jgi:hypothetical protein